MVYDNYELFNVAETQETQDGMIILRRYPEYIVGQMSVPEFDADGNETNIHTGHRAGARACVGVEIRFVSDENEIGFTVECKQPISAFVFAGDWQVAHFSAIAGRHSFKAAKNANLIGVNRQSFNRFSSKLWRIVLDSEEPVAVKVDKVNHKLPASEDLPKVTALSYGSSITKGVGTPFPNLRYINVAAENLGWQVKNKAISGGCFCEEAVCDFICGEEFDIGYFELGTNIANRPYPVIDARVGKFIDKVCETFPEKKMYFVTPVKGLSDVSSAAPAYAEYFANTRRIITMHVGKYRNAVLLDGHELLNKDYYLSHDILHPSAFGHVMMGINLTEMIGKSK